MLMMAPTRLFVTSRSVSVLVLLLGMPLSCMWDGRLPQLWQREILFVQAILPSLLHSLISISQFIFKSSEKSPLSALALGHLVKEAGFPPGVIQFVSGPGKTGALLASNMTIAKISYTGSTAVGKIVQKAALDSNMKKVTLELGGKSPAIVFADADIENAVGS